MAKKGKTAALRRVERDAVFQSFAKTYAIGSKWTAKWPCARLLWLKLFCGTLFKGIGKPEPLKYLAAGTWSRRLTQEHRMVYLVSADRIDFLQARYHY